MKRCFIFTIILLLLITFSSCNFLRESSPEGTAYEFIKSYFTFYDTEKIIDYETYEKLGNDFLSKFKPYMTDKVYRSFISSRDPYQIFDIAAKGRTTVEIRDIKLKLKKEYNEDNSLYYEFSGEIFINPLGEIRPTKQSANIAGEIMVTEHNNTFMITHFVMRGTVEWFDLIKNFESVLY